MGVKRATEASSPVWAARMTRLYNRSNRSRADIPLMSGALPSSPGGPADAAVAATVASAGGRATITSTATNTAARAVPAMIHGVGSARTPRGAPVASCPHAEQNRAPGASAAPHCGQGAATRGAPQAEQKRPEPTTPHDAHAESETWVIR